MTPWPTSAVALAGSGVAFPACVLPSGETTTSLETTSLFESLTPDLPQARRSTVLAHVAETIGVRRRSWAHWVGGPLREDEPDATSLGIEAARAALASANVRVEDLGFLVFTTSTAPRWTSPAAAATAGALGARCPFLDIRSGCAGGLYAVALASVLAMSSKRPVLAIGSDTFSKVLSLEERFAVLSMGDGAGALVVTPSAPGRGTMRAAFGGNGALHELATVAASMPPRTLDRAAWTLGGDPARFGSEIERALHEAMRETIALAPSAPALHLVHAGRRSVCEQVSRQVSPEAPVWLESLAEHGNLGAASVMVGLHEARVQGAWRRGATIAIASAGGGPSWGGMVWEDG